MIFIPHVEGVKGSVQNIHRFNGTHVRGIESLIYIADSNTKSSNHMKIQLDSWNYKKL